MSGSPFCTILKYPYLVTDPKSIYSNFGRQYILILGGEHAPKKREFLSKFSNKRLKTPLFACFLKILTATQNSQNKVSTKTGSFTVWESSENQFGRTKKNRQKFRKVSDNPPLQKILNPPLPPPAKFYKALFLPPPPNLTRASIFWCNAWFYKARCIMKTKHV